MEDITFEAKRTGDGAIDYTHYAKNAVIQRREARSAALCALGRNAKRGLYIVIGLVSFWNIPPMGGIAAKESSYR